MRAAGMSRPDIAKHFGVSVNAIRHWMEKVDTVDVDNRNLAKTRRSA